VVPQQGWEALPHATHFACWQVVPGAVHRLLGQQLLPSAPQAPQAPFVQVPGMPEQAFPAAEQVPTPVVLETMQQPPSAQ
jgi:hypothetical protein